MSALLTAISCFVCLAAQDAPFSLRVNVPVVFVDVVVTDSQGRSVTNLTQKDFTALEDGIPQQIRNFSSPRTPYSALLLFDCSESTRDRANLIVSAMARFAEELRPQDRIAVAAFGQDVKLLLDWKADKRNPIEIESDPTCRGSDVYGALDWATKKMRGVDGRGGVIVFTDGFHTDIARKDVRINGDQLRRVVPPAEDRDFQKVLKTVRESALPFYFVAVDTDLNPGPRYAGPVPDLQQLRFRMEQLSDISGGRIVFPKKTGEITPFFLQIGRDLGTSYSLGYIAPNTSKDGSHRKIEIQVVGEGLEVTQSRNDYVSN